MSHQKGGGTSIMSFRLSTHVSEKQTKGESGASKSYPLQWWGVPFSTKRALSPAWFVTQVPRDRRGQLWPVVKICKPTLEEQDQRAAPRSPLSKSKVIELETAFVADSALEGVRGVGRGGGWEFSFRTSRGPLALSWVCLSYWPCFRAAFSNWCKSVGLRT